MSSPDPSKITRQLTERRAGEAVPPADLQHLAEAVIKAHGFAERERVLTGYLVLYGGLMAAEQQTEPWARKLAALWDEALDEYKTLYPRNWGDLD